MYMYYRIENDDAYQIITWAQKHYIIIGNQKITERERKRYGTTNYA